MARKKLIPVVITLTDEDMLALDKMYKNVKELEGCKMLADLREAGGTIKFDKYQGAEQASAFFRNVGKEKINLVISGLGGDVRAALVSLYYKCSEVAEWEFLEFTENEEVTIARFG